MSKKLLIKLYKNHLKYIKTKMNKIKENKMRFIIINKELYYNTNKNQFYVKIATTAGFLCRDITLEEIFSPHSTILESLDKDSLCYIYYVAGKLEDLANHEHNSIYTFQGVSPHNQNIFIVKSLLDLSIHEWDIHDAYAKELYYNLDKPSIARFMERYLIAQQSKKASNTNNSNTNHNNINHNDMSQSVQITQSIKNNTNYLRLIK